MMQNLMKVGLLIILFSASAHSDCGDKFQCLNNKCIDKKSVNDGKNDCEDNSDEDHLYNCYNYQGHNASFQSNEHALYKCLTSNYIKHVRPVRRESDPVNVEFGVVLTKITDLSWDDMLIKWNKDDFGGLDQIKLPVNQLWSPDIMLYNSVEPWSYGNDMKAKVSSNGKVTWLPQVMMKSFCKMDFTKFPYDTQTCHLKFGSWTYSSNEVNVTMYTHRSLIAKYNFNPHPEFEVTSTNGIRNEVKYDCCTVFVDMTYSLTLRRRSSHYVSMLVAPVVTLLLLLPAMFVLPAGCGEKTHLGVGILVSLVLLLVVIVEFLPIAHANLPYIGQFYLASMVLVSLSMLCSAMVTSCWTRANRRGNVPRLLRMIFLGFVSSLLCVRRDDHVPDDYDNATNLGKLEDNLELDPAEDRLRLVRTYDRTMAIAEWRQLTTVLDRIFMILFFIIAIILAIAYLK